MINTSMPTPKTIYLSHEDFIKCRLYDIEAQNHGTFEDRVKQFNNDIQAHINTYGYCPREIYEQKALYIHTWANAWRNYYFIRVDVATGEVDEPCK